MTQDYLARVSLDQDQTSRQTHLKIYKRRMRIFRWCFVAALIIVLGLFVTHLTFIVVKVTSQSKDCSVDEYLIGPGGDIDKIYHIIRGIFLILLNTWLIVATQLTFSLMRRNSTRKSEFSKEICAIGTAYWTFVACYAGWLCLYIFEALSSSKSESAYDDQIQTVAISGLICSITPIMILFLIHFLSYTSVSNLFKVTVSKLSSSPKSMR